MVPFSLEAVNRVGRRGKLSDSINGLKVSLCALDTSAGSGK